MALHAFYTKKSSVNGRVINGNFVVIWKQGNLKVKENDKETESEIERFNVDLHHLIAHTVTKGNKNDHDIYNVSLGDLIKHYQNGFPDMIVVPLKNAIV